MLVVVRCSSCVDGCPVLFVLSCVWLLADCWLLFVVCCSSGVGCGLLFGVLLVASC